MTPDLRIRNPTNDRGAEQIEKKLNLEYFLISSNAKAKLKRMTLRCWHDSTPDVRSWEMLPHEKPVTSKAGWEPQTDEAAEQHKN